MYAEDIPAIGRGGKLVPALSPLMHFVRWSPRERRAFVSDGHRCVGFEVVTKGERCPICRAPVAHPTGAAVEDPRERHRSAVTPVWCCLREVPR